MMTDATEICPKSMSYGPCGGVRPDGSCEVDQRPCPFVDHLTLEPPPPSGSQSGARSVGVPHGFWDIVARPPLILVDVRAPRSWRGDLQGLWEATADTLDGCVALIGEHVDNPAQDDDSGGLPTAAVIGTLAARGVPVVVTVTGRDRSLAEAQQLIAAHRDAGACAIHCVTGDHPASMGIARPVCFGAEAMSLIALTVAAGLPAVTAESPASPGFRAQRLAMKRRAGAAAAVLNHCGEVDHAIAFADACRQAGNDIPLIAPVAMVGDAHAAQALEAFPGLRLPRATIHAVATSTDPHEAGLAAATQHCRSVAESGRFAGVNLSGSGWGQEPIARLDATAAFIAVVRQAWCDAKR